MAIYINCILLNQIKIIFSCGYLFFERIFIYSHTARLKKLTIIIKACLPKTGGGRLYISNEQYKLI